MATNDNIKQSQIDRFIEEITTKCDELDKFLLRNYGSIHKFLPPEPSSDKKDETSPINTSQQSSFDYVLERLNIICNRMEENTRKLEEIF